MTTAVKIFFIGRNKITHFSDYVLGYDGIIGLNVEKINKEIDTIKVIIRYENAEKTLFFPKDKFLVEITFNI